jgi:hypothetical protein
MATLCTRTEVKNALGISDNIDDSRIDISLEAATEMIQDYCGRQFLLDSTTSARIYNPDTTYLIYVDDISTTMGFAIATDDGGDGTFSNVWQTTDYQLEPLNQKVNGSTRPYNSIRAVATRYFPQDYGRATVKVTAKWGWSPIPNSVRQAAIIQTISIFKAPDAPFGATPFADTGILRLRSALHPTAAALLSDFRLEPIQVA